MASCTAADRLPVATDTALSDVHVPRIADSGSTVDAFSPDSSVSQDSISTPDTSPQGTWTSMLSGTNQNLKCIWGSGPKSIYAAGAFVVLHSDGTSWSVVKVPQATRFWEIWGTSASNIYMAGESGVLLHYDGFSWSSINTGTTSTLGGVWGTAPDNIYVVGDSGTVLHYNGLSWTKINTGYNAYYAGVWGSGPNDVFLLGSDAIVHWNGAMWQVQATFPKYMVDIWGNGPNDVFAVGTFGLQHFDGNTWSGLSLPMAPKAGLLGIWGLGKNVYAVGFPGAPGDPSMVLHFDGSSWLPLTTGYNTYILQDAWGDTQGNIYVVGDSGTILRYAP